MGKQPHLPWVLLVEQACPPGAFGSAARTTPVVRHLCSRGEVLQLTQIWGWNGGDAGTAAGQRRKVHQGQEGQGHVAAWEDRDLPGAGADALATVPEACAPPLAWDARSAWGFLEQVLRQQTRKDPRRMPCPWMIPPSPPGHQQQRHGQVRPQHAPLSGGGGERCRGQWAHGSRLCGGPSHSPW